MQQQQLERPSASLKQLLAEARKRCRRGRPGGDAAPVLLRSPHGSLALQPAAGGHEQPPTAPGLPTAAAPARPASRRARPALARVCSPAAEPPSAVALGAQASAGPPLLSPTVARLDTSDCAVLELLQAAAELAPPWEGQQLAPASAADRHRPPSTSASLRDWRQQWQRQQRQPASPLAQQLAALRRIAEQQGAAACGGGGTAKAGHAAATSLLPTLQLQLSHSPVHAASVLQAASSSLGAPKQHFAADAAAAAAAETPPAPAQSMAASASGPAMPVTEPAAAVYPAAAPRVGGLESACLSRTAECPAPMQPAGAASCSRATSGSQEQAGAERSRPSAAGADAAACEPSAACQPGQKRAEASPSAGPAAPGAPDAAATSAAADDLAAALDAAAAALRAYCTAGGYDEAREVLRGAGRQALPLLLAARDAEGRTPLMLACMGGHGRLVKLLLRKGAALDAQDGEGNTALALTVLRGHQAVARHLLECGADASRRNAAGASAADLVAGWVARSGSLLSLHGL